MGRRSRKHRSEFLDDDCGQNALQLAARGSTIIAEILRLSEHIPIEFKEPEKTGYAQIICDYRYFSCQDEFEKVIQNSSELLQKDEEFCETHMELLDRFFKLFRGVHGYVMELNRFVEEIREGMYISQTVESILINLDGKQLLCEIFHLYGVMLLLLDYKIGGRVREHLIVSYIRYKGAGEQNTVEVTNMCRRTGYEADAPLPERYPVQYFNRVAIDKEIVNMLIGRIRSDDVYQMSYNYPTPEHRSVALSMQGAILYVLLFFRPEILTSEGPVMREIVDKHFADNWVINYYMGFTVDLTVAWKSFPAARNAIAGTIAVDNVQYHLQRMNVNLVKLNKDIAEYLREGVLTEQYVLDNIHSLLLPCIRDANVTLRWFMLHITRGGKGRSYLAEYKRSYEVLTDSITPDSLITLLLSTAQLEFLLRDMFVQFLKQKKGKWEKAKEEGSHKMSKLSTYFSGEHVLSDNVKDPQLEAWFEEISERITSLEYTDSVTANRKVQKLMKALENVLEFHQIDSNLQVVQFVQDTRFLLRQMIRYINIENKVLITIATVGDLSYVWELMSTYGCFVPELQRKIKLKPGLAVQMRSFFVKLSSMLELPCNRIDQGAQNDKLLLSALETTSEYYSNDLVTFARHVLHIIPISIFDVLRQIMRLITDTLRECPTKLAKKDMKSQSQLAEREVLSRLTADISKYASGILAMESTLVGVIQIDPHQLLEDGIRKELVEQITDELHKSLNYDPAKVLTAADLGKELGRLAHRLNGIRSSFEYIQDYVNVHGLRIWIEEFARIVNFNVEMECNSFLQKKLYHWKSKYQSDSIPIPYYERLTPRSSYSFLGRIVQHLLSMTESKRALFLPSLGGWYDRTTLEEVVGMRTFSSISEAIGLPGLSALDLLLRFITAKDLQLLLNGIRTAIEPHQETLARIREQLVPVTMTPQNAIRDYSLLVDTLSKSFDSMIEIFLRLGRIQLMRCMIANELRSTCKLDSSSLFSVLSTANRALLMDLDRHYHNPDEFPIPGEIIAQISPFLDNVGISDVRSKVYITSKPLPDMVFYLIALSVRNVGHLQFDTQLGVLTPRKANVALDAAPFSFAVALLLKQFHSDQKDLFFGHIAQAIRASVVSFENVEEKLQTAEVLPTFAENLTHLLGLIADYSHVSLDFAHRLIPPSLFGIFRQAAKSASKKR